MRTEYNITHCEGISYVDDEVWDTEWVEVNSNRLGLDKYITHIYSREEWDAIIAAPQPQPAKQYTYAEAAAIVAKIRKK